MDVTQPTSPSGPPTPPADRGPWVTRTWRQHRRLWVIAPIAAVIVFVAVRAAISVEVDLLADEV